MSERGLRVISDFHAGQRVRVIRANTQYGRTGTVAHVASSTYVYVQEDGAQSTTPSTLSGWLPTSLEILDDPAAPAVLDIDDEERD